MDESGEPIVLTVDGRLVGSILPRETRSERRSIECVLADLAEIAAFSSALGVTSGAHDFDVGLTTDEMLD
jgi:antitoxin (DNA-binding transcriptional repressor) of toxin-antitoxin stability system